jgi:hypothetical protein
MFTVDNICFFFLLLRRYAITTVISVPAMALTLTPPSMFWSLVVVMAQSGYAPVVFDLYCSPSVFCQKSKLLILKLINFCWQI